MSEIAPGWYPDPVDRAVQRYWDGEGYLGDPLPADVTPPPGPPPVAAPPAVPTAGMVASAPPQTAQPAPPAQPHSPSPHAPAPQGAGAGPTSPAAPGPLTPNPYTPPRGTPPLPGGPGIGPGNGPGNGPLSGPISGPMTGMPGWPAYPRLVLPAPRPHGYRLAGLGARFMARFVDTLAVLGLNFVINGYFVYQYYQVNLPFWQEFSRRFYAGESTAGVEPPERSSTLLVIILLLATALWFAYEVPAHASTGQTLGKRLFGIKVMRLESDEPLGFRRSIRRWNTIGLPTLVWPCYGVGFLLQFIDAIWPTFDRPMHQALHDKSALTVVVQATPSPTASERRNDDPQERAA